MFRFVCLSTVIGILFFAFVCFWPAVNKDHAGPTKILDVNTIEVRGEQHRLYGVMGADQACRQWNQEPQSCAKETIAALVAFLHGRTATCQVRQELGDAKRFVSICYVGRQDIGAWMVDNGWAMADRAADLLHGYVSNEHMARFLRKGFWNGTTSLDTRQREREEEE